MENNVVLQYFRELEQIPRGSGNEKGVSDYLVNFAKSHGLEVVQDKALNVIIKKPATAGYENNPTIILQGHMDMVCEKTPESNHNFLTDPIELVIDGEWLKAKETTLGADNGVAVAMALAVLAADDVAHGPLEVLVTTSEETGMDGAVAVDGSLLSGKYLLNLDTEEEGEFIASCAGGCMMEVIIPRHLVTTPAHYTKGIRLSINGLLGGHSGIEIHKQRANANQLLARTLYELRGVLEFDLASFSGGSKHNAIPRQATALIAIKEADVDTFLAMAKEKTVAFRQEFTPQDGEVEIVCAVEECPAQVFDAMRTSMPLIQFLYVAPHGVVGMSKSLEDLVETSLNLGVVTEEEDKLTIIAALRSSSVGPLTYLRNRIATIGQMLGLTVNVKGGYPAWEYEAHSSLEEQATALYERVTGEKPKVTAIHAGLECGLLKERIPQAQMISFGPTIKGAHTPEERLHLPSMARMYDFLLLLLKELK